MGHTGPKQPMGLRFSLADLLGPPGPSFLHLYNGAGYLGDAWVPVLLALPELKQRKSGPEQRPRRMGAVHGTSPCQQGPGSG